MDSSDITSFYRNKSLLLTGVTGFCGKVLLEKILRCCKEVSTIFVLIRPKVNLTAEQRLNKLLRSRPFTFNLLESSQLCKVKAINCDISQLFSSISQQNLQLLIDQVNVIFHVAACVKFDAGIKANFSSNVHATQEMIILAKAMKKLKCFIHVSTAYSNCQNKFIEEKLYPLPLEVDSIVNTLENTADDDLKDFENKFFQGRPNSYVFTKAIAEHIVSTLSTNVPVAIVRPSIVLPSMREPVPGWVDSVNGPLSLLMLSSIGILVTSNYNYNIKPDTVSVDHLANFMLSVAWYINVKSSAKLSIYNFTSTSFNPNSFDVHSFLECGFKACLTSPTRLTIRPSVVPSRHNDKSKLRFTLEKFFFHFLYALFIDSILKIIGYKPLLLRYVNKMHKGMDIMRYFATREWRFKSDNVINVMNAMNNKDRDLYDIDISYKDLDSFVNILWRGGRRYLLKDPDSTIPQSKRNYIMVCVLYRLFIGTIYYSLGLAILSIFPMKCPQWLLFFITLGVNIIQLIAYLFRIRPYISKEPYNLPESQEYTNMIGR